LSDDSIATPYPLSRAWAWRAALAASRSGYTVVWSGGPSGTSMAMTTAMTTRGLQGYRMIRTGDLWVVLSVGFTTGTDPLVAPFTDPVRSSRYSKMASRYIIALLKLIFIIACC
jgi:hypothetical protein